MKALLIDDSSTMRAIGRAVLAGIGAAEIREAEDGAEALSALAGFEPDVIIVDGRMPRMDGPTFVARYRAAGGRAGVVLTLTPGAYAPAVPPGARGADVVLTKPFTPDVLSQRAMELLSIGAAATG